MSIAGFRYDEVVASGFTLQRQSRINPPDGRMKEEKGLQYFLCQIGPIVSAAKMPELV